MTQRFHRLLADGCLVGEVKPGLGNVSIICLKFSEKEEEWGRARARLQMGRNKQTGNQSSRGVQTAEYIHCTSSSVMNDPRPQLPIHSPSLQAAHFHFPDDSQPSVAEEVPSFWTPEPHFRMRSSCVHKTEKILENVYNILNIYALMLYVVRVQVWSPYVPGPGTRQIWN